MYKHNKNILICTNWQDYFILIWFYSSVFLVFLLKVNLSWVFLSTLSYTYLSCIWTWTFIPSFKIPGRNLEETVLNQRYVSSWRLYFTEHSSSFSLFQPKFLLSYLFLFSCHFSEDPWSFQTHGHILLPDIKLLFLTYSFPNYKKQTRGDQKYHHLIYIFFLKYIHPSIHNCITSLPLHLKVKKVCLCSMARGK